MRRFLWRAAAGAAVLAVAVAALGSQQYPMRTYTCHRAAGPIVLDGLPHEAGWRAARWSDSFGDMFHPDQPVAQQTWVRACWDDHALYLALRAYDDDPWATLRQRDAALFSEEVLEVYVDENDDQKNYLEFEVNPLGAEIDLLIPYAGAQADWPTCARWNAPGWKTAVRVQPPLAVGGRRIPGQWVVEMAFPWAIFAEAARTPPRPGDVWRIQFYRIERPDRTKPDEIIGTSWSPTPTFHAPRYFGAIRFEP
jgi:hypothetical protein